MRTRFVLRCLVVLLAATWVPAARAQGSTYVPFLDPAYADLEAIEARGLVRAIMMGERPFSRAAFARFVAEARRRRPAAGVLPSATAEALERLEARFAPDDTGNQGRVTLAAAAASITAASARARGMAANGGPPGTQIDADLNPLLQRNQGRVVLDGLTGAAEGGLIWQRGHYAAEATARAWTGLPQGRSADANVDLVAGYGRAVWGPVALDLGRTAYANGFGPDGGAMFSTNPRALDQVRLRADRPVHLPGVLRHLGLWQGTLGLANLGWNRDNPNGSLLIMRLAGKPSPYVEWGVSYQVQHSGEGLAPQYQWMRLQEMFLPFRKAGWVYEVVDRVAGAELRLALPQTRSSLYANFLTTDERYRFQMLAGGYWEDAIWVGGFEQRGLGPDGRLDLRLEGRHHGPIAQTHHQFTSGMTVDRRTLGDFMGPNAEGVSLSGTWNGTHRRLSVEASMERYLQDVYEIFPSPSRKLSWDHDWRRLSNRPKELRQRLTASWLSHAGWHGQQTTVRLGYERVVRFEWSDRTRHNAMVELSVRALR